MKKILSMIIGLVVSTIASAAFIKIPLIGESSTSVSFVINEKFISTMTTDPLVGALTMTVFNQSIDQLADNKIRFKVLSTVDNFKDNTMIHLVQFDCSTKIGQFKLIGTSTPVTELSTEPWSDSYIIAPYSLFGILGNLSCGYKARSK